MEPMALIGATMKSSKKAASRISVCSLGLVDSMAGEVGNCHNTAAQISRKYFVGGLVP